LGLEGLLQSFDLLDYGCDGLVGNAELAEEDVDEATEALKLLHHFNVSCWSFDFLLVEVFDIFDGLDFAFGFNQVEDELSVLLVLFVKMIAFVNQKA
jgi:hypothetical protein